MCVGGSGRRSLAGRTVGVSLAGVDLSVVWAIFGVEARASHGVDVPLDHRLDHSGSPSGKQELAVILVGNVWPSLFDVT